MNSNNKRVHFDEAGPSKKLEMDPETAKKLFESGATLILLDVPIGTEIGIDMQSWNTASEFKGIKMIPSGLHFVYFSSVSKENSVGPRSGFFHNFTQSEILVKKFDAQNETFVDCQENVENFRYVAMSSSNFTMVLVNFTLILGGFRLGLDEL